MDNCILNKSETRGHTIHGWLNSHHSFSFNKHYDPKRMHFGTLKVLNDDTVQAGKGFGTHPHENMEIISIPLEGDLEHKDSLDNVSIIRYGDIQVMSAGSGITHSEYNKNKDHLVKFLQIWIMPNKKNVTPRYDQITLNAEDRKNKFQQIVSPNIDDEGVWIYQDAWLHLGTFDEDSMVEYFLKKKGNGIYVFVISGNVTVEDQELNARDGFAIWNVDQIIIQSNSPSEILIIEVPMEIPIFSK